MEEITIRKLGVKFSPAALVMTYQGSLDDSIHRRTIPVRNITKESNIETICNELTNSPKHHKFLEKIAKSQLMKMLTLIKDKMNGLSLDESLAKNERLNQIDPDEDLNKADDETLVRKKAAMDDLYNKNLKKPTDPDFQYDIEVDFGTNDAVETLNWSDDDDFEF